MAKKKEATLPVLEPVMQITPQKPTRHGRRITMLRADGSSFFFDTDLYDQEIKKAYPTCTIGSVSWYRDPKANHDFSGEQEDGEPAQD